MKKLPATTVYYLRTAVSELNSGLIITGIYAWLVLVMELTPFQLLLIGTVIMVTALLFEVPTGIVADIYSRRLSVIIGGVLIGVCYTLTGLFPIYLVTLLAATIEAIGDTFVSGAWEAWITDEVGAERVGQVFLRGMQIGSVGHWVGSGLSILLATWFGYHVPIVLGGVLWLVLSGVLVLTMPETGFVRREELQRAPLRAQLDAALTTVRDGVRLVRGTPILLLLFTAQLFVGAFFEGFFRIYRAHLLTSFTLPALRLPLVGLLDVIAWFGVLDVLNSLLNLVGAEVVRRFVALNRPTLVARMLTGFYAIVIVCGLIFALSGTFTLAAVALLAVQLCQQLAQPITSAWLNQHIAADVRATVLSMSSQVNTFGQLGGGLGVGVVSNRFGIRAGLVVATLFVTPLLALYAGSASRVRRSVTTSHGLTGGTDDYA
jgi:DHA3 family tetracycline resistance protein-like MFS transporter